MAKHTCAICGVEMNLFSEQKLADGNYICRKTCQKRGLKVFDCIPATLPQFQAHVKQVEDGTGIWNYYFVPRRKTKDKSQKLGIIADKLFFADDIGLCALLETRYKFMNFGKSELACVYRIADLYEYELEKEEQKDSNGKPVTKYYCHFYFRGVEGMSDFRLETPGGNYYEKMIVKPLDTKFGIQRTLGNMGKNMKSGFEAFKAVKEGVSAAIKNDAEVNEKAEKAAEALDAATYGDRTDWIAKADTALNTYYSQKN